MNSQTHKNTCTWASEYTHMHTHTHTRTNTYTHLHTYTHAHTKQKLMAAVTPLVPPSILTLGCLTPCRHLSLVWQILLGRASNAREDCPGLMDICTVGCGTYSSTTTSHHQGQSRLCFPSYFQVPDDVTAGWAASSVDTRSLFNSWVI